MEFRRDENRGRCGKVAVSKSSTVISLLKCLFFSLSLLILQKVLKETRERLAWTEKRYIRETGGSGLSGFTTFLVV